MAFYAGGVIAQPRPDAGSLLENQKQQEQFRNQVPELPVIEPKQERKKKISSSQKIVITGFKFVGDISVFSKEELLGLVKNAIGNAYDLNGLNQLIARITKHYQQAGYFLAKAYLPPQDITEGMIIIAVQEGKLDTRSDGVTIQGENLRIDSGFAKSFINEEVKPGNPLQKKKLERAVLLLNDLPGLVASANLERGADAGSSQIKILVKEAAIYETTANIDNGGNRYTGAEKASLYVNANDLSGYGDQVSVILNTSGSNNNYVSLGYQIPVGSSGLKLGLNYSYLEYLLGKELKVLDAQGTARNTTVNVSYPLYRTRRQSLYVNTAYDWKEYVDKANGSTTSDKNVDAFSVAFSGNRFDNVFGGGVNQAQLLFKTGDLDLSGEPASLLADQAMTGPQRNGRYRKLVYSLSRLQKINNDLVLFASINGQLANKNLDSSERLQMGGPTGVRAYPVGEASVDEGYKTTLEARYTIKRGTQFGDIQAIVFYDRADLKQFNRVGGQILNTPNDFSISGWGVGFNIVKSDKYNISASWARKSGKNPIRNPVTGLDADGLDDKSRFWFTASLSF